MDIERRIELITRAPTEEVITNEDLKKLLETKDKVTAYDGFEPSGLLHLGSGVMRAIKLQDMLDAKVEFMLYIADWFAALNNKFGGDMELIKQAGKYFIEGWKACGIDMNKVSVKWASEAVADENYFKGVLELAKITTINRMIRTAPIMGRSEAEMMFTSQIIYPFMQAYDPLYFGIDILQLGMDQRRVTILTREMAPKFGKPKPVLVHHHLLIGLQGPGQGRMGQEQAMLEAKMSKSKPETAIFIHDSREEIERKINSAFCPELKSEGNAIMEMWKYIIFRKFDSRVIQRKRDPKLEVQSFEELEKNYAAGKIHPMDLKKETTDAIDEILKPVRAHFEKSKAAKKLYETVKNAQVTR